MAKYLTIDDLKSFSEEDIGEYPLPFDPETLVRVKSVPMARMKQYQEAVQKGGSVATSATKALIRDSIVGPDGQPLYSAETSESMLKGRTRLVAAMLAMISKHNGGDDKVAEDAEKKSDQAD